MRQRGWNSWELHRNSHYPPTVDTPFNIVSGVNDTLVVSVDGTTSGTITLNGAASPGQSYTSGSALATELQNKINADATLTAAGRRVTVNFDRTTNRLLVRSNLTGGASAVDVTGGTARAGLGLSGERLPQLPGPTVVLKRFMSTVLL